MRGELVAALLSGFVAENSNHLWFPNGQPHILTNAEHDRTWRATPLNDYRLVFDLVGELANFAWASNALTTMSLFI